MAAQAALRAHQQRVAPPRGRPGCRGSSRRSRRLTGERRRSRSSRARRARAGVAAPALGARGRWCRHASRSRRRRWCPVTLTLRVTPAAGSAGPGGRGGGWARRRRAGSRRYGVDALADSDQVAPAAGRAELRLGLSARVADVAGDGGELRARALEDVDDGVEVACAAGGPRRCGARALHRVPDGSAQLRAGLRLVLLERRLARRAARRGGQRQRGRDGAVVLAGGAAWAVAGAGDEDEQQRARAADSRRSGCARRSPYSTGLRSSRCTAGPWSTVAVGREARAVAGAVPAALGGVPVDLAAEVACSVWRRRRACRRRRGSRRPSRRRGGRCRPRPGARSSIGRVPRLVSRSPTKCSADLGVLLDEPRRGGAQR